MLTGFEKIYNIINECRRIRAGKLIIGYKHLNVIQISECGFAEDVAILAST